MWVFNSKHNRLVEAGEIKKQREKREKKLEHSVTHTPKSTIINNLQSMHVYNKKS